MLQQGQSQCMLQAIFPFWPQSPSALVRCDFASELSRADKARLVACLGRQGCFVRLRAFQLTLGLVLPCLPSFPGLHGYRIC